MRLILSPEHHDLHHRHPYADNYCITNGWMDGPLRFLRFFAVLEWILTKLSGVLPRHTVLEQAPRDPHAESHERS
jgi:ubiquitin-conjugating enzyme E2 variant